MATIFSDIAKQSAVGNSLIVQRYHGGLATTLINGLTIGDLGAQGNVIYLCPIPWHARIVEISYVLSADGDATTQPKGNFYVRGTNRKMAKTLTDLSNLEYNQILATANDFTKASVDKGGTTKSLAGWTIVSNNEYPLYEGIEIDLSSGTTGGEENYLILPFEARKCTCSEACAFQTKVPVGDTEKETNVFGENALGIADTEHYGMLTWKCTTAQVAGTTTTNLLFKVTYVEPSPSGIVTGKIATNS